MSHKQIFRIDSSLPAISNNQVSTISKSHMEPTATEVARPPPHRSAQTQGFRGKIFRSLVESLEGFAVFMLSPDGTVQTWNSGAARLFGYSERGFINRLLSVLYPPPNIRNTNSADRLASELGDKLHLRARDYLSRIRVSSLPMVQLIDDLLNLSRLGHQDMQKETVDLPHGKWWRNSGAPSRSARSSSSRNGAAGARRSEPAQDRVRKSVRQRLEVYGQAASCKDRVWSHLPSQPDRLLRARPLRWFRHDLLGPPVHPVSAPARSKRVLWGWRP
jgi:hypothetical protein